MSDGLTDFRAFMKSLFGLIVAGTAATALVLVTALLGIAPPWPSAIVQVTAVSQLVVLALVYQLSIGVGRKSVNRAMVAGAVIVAFSAAAYMSLFSLLAYNHGVRGFFCTSAAAEVYGNSCPLLSQADVDEALRPDDLWTPLGLLLGRIFLLVAWIGTFASIVWLMGTFVAFQRTRQIRRPPA